MAQAKLIRAEEVENGIKLTFLDFDGNEKSGVYNGKKLDLEDFEKLGKKMADHHFVMILNMEWIDREK